MIQLKPLLKELRVTDLSKGKATKLFVAWRDKLFIMDDNSDPSPVIHWLEDHPAFDTKSGFDGETPYEVISYVSTDMPPDVVAGIYYQNEKSLSIQGADKGNPITSVIISKIIRQLGIKKVSRSSAFRDDDTIYSAKKNIGTVPKVGFHGTNTLNLKGILQRGIEAGVGPGNFRHTGVVHTIDSFFSSVFDDAEYYANNSTVDRTKHDWSKGGHPEKSGAYPVVIEFNVPDPDKVIPDFDADAHSLLQRFYSHESPPKKFGASPMKPMGLSKEAGKFGYRGRILPGHIKTIHLYSDAMKKWRKFKPSTVSRGLWVLGSDWYYRVGIGMGD
jgi:hypothetical protein